MAIFPSLFFPHRRAEKVLTATNPPFERSGDSNPQESGTGWWQWAGTGLAAGERDKNWL